MKKLAIISSYHEMCGISTYTETLERAFRKHFEVTVLSLDLDLLSSSNRRIRKQGDQHIREIAKKLKEYDYVNIQFEAGLYGTHPSEILERLRLLIEASRNLILTFHSVYAPVSLFDKNILKQMVSDGFFHTLGTFYRQSIYPRLYKGIIDLLKKKQKHDNVHVIVHNLTDKKVLRLLYDFENTEAFPLTYLSKEERADFKQPANKEWLRTKFRLNEQDIIIGLFGFVSLYKGYDTALDALRFLPSNYKVIICGEQHPMSIKPFEVVEPYLKQLLQMMDKNHKLMKDRVLWLGGISDHNQFVNVMRCCDFVVLPYLEVNQSGSGIATLAIETRSKCLFSNSKTFTKLKKFYPNCFDSFDIGNSRELASKIKYYTSDHAEAIEQCLSVYNIENHVLLYKNLFEKGRN